MGTRAGAIAGLAGFATFIVVHSLWIVPIWHIAPVGAVMALGIGAVVGGAFEALLPNGRPTWRATAGLFVAVAGALLPAAVLAELGLRAGVAPLAWVVAGLLGSASLMGAVIGALVGRTWRSAGACALGAVLLAVGPGHNIPMLASTPAVPRELALLLAVFAVSAVAFTSAYRRLVRDGASAQSARSGVAVPAEMR